MYIFNVRTYDPEKACKILAGQFGLEYRTHAPMQVNFGYVETTSVLGLNLPAKPAPYTMKWIKEKEGDEDDW